MSKVNESNGGTGSGSIAPNMDRRQVRSSESDWRSGIKHDISAKGATEQEHVIRARRNMELLKKKKLANTPKEKFKSFISRTFGARAPEARFQIKESTNMQDVVSRLKGLEYKNEEDTITYGVEDDEGNLIKITVKGDQAKQFEQRMAEELAILQSLSNGLEGNPFGDQQQDVTKKNTSIAELLYNLKDTFTIVDVEFPQIPTDVIYNVDRATYNAPDTMNKQPRDGMSAGVDDLQGVEGDPEMDAMNPEMGDEQSLDMNPPEGEEGVEGSEDEMDVDPDDLDSAEDFQDMEDTGETDEKSMLSSILDMLKAEAEARKAGYEQAAEEAKAKQAEYSYKLATHTAAEQEELARVEAEMEEQKNKEKEAKKYADIAKFRVQKVKPAMESSTLGESEQLDTVQGLMRKKQGLRQQFQILPNDTQEDKAYKNASFITANREIDLQIRRAKMRDQYLKSKGKKEQEEIKKQKDQDSKNPQQNNNQNPNAQNPNVQNPNAAPNI